MKTFVVVVLLLVLATTAYAARYTLTDLSGGSTVGGNRATAISESGVVAGARLDSSGTEHAFYYDGTLHDLPALSGFAHGAATGINNAGAIVGYSRPDPSSGAYHAFLWQSGTMTDLGTIPGYDFWTIACAINNSGQIAGTSYSRDFRGRAFLYQGGATVQDLNSLIYNRTEWPYVELTRADAINDIGQVVVFAGGSAFIWEDGDLTDLGVLPSGSSSSGFGINNLGQVVGEARSYTGENHAFLYDGTMHDLGALPGYMKSVGKDINDLGQIVGGSSNDYYNKHAFLYENGIMYDLNSLIDPTYGLTLQEASAINNLGQIVGFGLDAQGRQHAFLLTPVPEPSSISALALGLVPLAGAGLRRRRVAALDN